MIRYVMKLDQTELLGPGSRAALWVQGCSRHCPGCIAEEMNRAEAFVQTAEELAEWFLSTGAQGLTVSGGEPFEQPEELAEMIRLIRRKKADVNVLIYSGFQLEELENAPVFHALLAEADVLIDGPFKREQNRGFFAVGSDNQRIIRLTERIGGDHLRNYYVQDRPRKVELHITADGIQMVGVPSDEQLHIWHTLREQVAN